MDRESQLIAMISDRIAKAKINLEVEEQQTIKFRLFKWQPVLLILTLAFITSMYGLSLAERSELTAQVTELSDLAKRPIPTLQAVTFSPYKVVTPADNCEGLIQQFDQWEICKSF